MCVRRVDRLLTDGEHFAQMTGGKGKAKTMDHVGTALRKNEVCCLLFFHKCGRW